MLWHLYIRDGTAYVPVVARTEAGFYMDIDPVAVIRVTDTEGLQRAIKDAMSKGNPIVPTPTRATFPKPVVLKHTKFKTWSAFGTGAECFEICEKGNIFQIQQAQKTPSGGWEDNPAKIESLPPGTTPADVARRVVAMVQFAINH